MGILDALVERRIAQAIAEGALDDLPGAGKPLILDDDRMIPEDLRVAYRILRNAGYIPPEIEQRREMADLAALMRHATDEAERRCAAARFALLCAKLEAEGRPLSTAGDYRERIAGKIGR
jgi:hypothetical protein